MINPSKKAGKIQEFWSWFQNNKHMFVDMLDNGEEKVFLINEKLKEIDNGLTVEIGYDSLYGAGEIVITTEGKLDKFPIAKEIVKRAPSMKDWTTIALRPPGEGNFTINYQDFTLTPSHLFFVPHIMDDTLDITIYGEGFKDQDEGLLVYYGLMMLQVLLGEYNSAVKVANYYFLDLEEADEKEQLMPLLSINKFIEGFYMNKN